MVGRLFMPPEAILYAAVFKYPADAERTLRRQFFPLKETGRVATEAFI
jgi:hypothetical protein